MFILNAFEIELLWCQYYGHLSNDLKRKKNESSFLAPSLSLCLSLSLSLATCKEWFIIGSAGFFLLLSMSDCKCFFFFLNSNIYLF